MICNALKLEMFLEKIHNNNDDKLPNFLKLVKLFLKPVLSLSHVLPDRVNESKVLRREKLGYGV